MLSAPVRSAEPERSSVRQVSDLPQLAVIFEPEVNVVALRRPLRAELDASVSEFCAMLGTRTLLHALAPTPRGREELAACLGTSNTLVEDIFRWVEVFADITDASMVGLRLVQLTTAMCPRFHVDRMELRMVLTYRGPGTEFVDRAALDLHDARLPEAFARIDTAAVQRAATGDVVLLKGEAWPQNAGRGAVHRSPAASPASPRLVLTLDVL